MFVYVISCVVTEKRYVGKSCMPAKRWTAHQTCARSGNQAPLYRAMRRYGVEAFEFEVVEQCASEAEAYEREAAWIAKLNSTTQGNGYNQTTGGEGLSGCLPETRERMSRAKRGVKQKPEAVAKRAASTRSNGKKAAVIEQIRELYSEGLNNSEIGARIGRTATRVGQLLVEMGLPANLPKAKPLLAAELDAIRAACKFESQRAVAKRFGRSESLVSNIVTGKIGNPESEKTQ